MLAIDARAARATWTVILVAFAVVVLYLIRRTLLIFAVALLLAYLLAPLVDLADRLSRRRFPRTLSLAAVYLLLLGIVGLVGAAVGSRIVVEASQLASKAPAWLAELDLLERLPAPAWLEPYMERVLAAIRAQLETGVKEALPLLGEIAERAIGLASSLVFVVVVPVLSFFFLKDGLELRRKLLDQIVPGPQRALLEDMLSDIHILLGQFMRALVILAFATFVFYGLFFWAAGVPYAALLAVLASALEFIPVIGPLSATVVILLVAGFGGNFMLAVWVLLFILAYRLLQDLVLQPYLMSSGLSLHPLWVLFGVLAGEQIAGLAGIFLSIPVLASLRVVFVRIQKSREAREPAQGGP